MSRFGGEFHVEEEKPDREAAAAADGQARVQRALPRPHGGCLSTARSEPAPQRQAGSLVGRPDPEVRVVQRPPQQAERRHQLLERHHELLPEPALVTGPHHGQGTGQRTGTERPRDRGQPSGMAGLHRRAAKRRVLALVARVLLTR